jgi:putative membrane protein
MEDQQDTSLRDRLARQRTELANERTLLSYIRTALGFIAVGIPAVWWLEGPAIQTLGMVSLVTGVVSMGIGIHRFLAVRAEINRPAD